MFLGCQSLSCANRARSLDQAMLTLMRWGRLILASSPGFRDRVEHSSADVQGCRRQPSLLQLGDGLRADADPAGGAKLANPLGLAQCLESVADVARPADEAQAKVVFDRV